jgi:hypothetical protein
MYITAEWVADQLEGKNVQWNPYSPNTLSLNREQRLKIATVLVEQINQRITEIVTAHRKEVQRG